MPRRFDRVLEDCGAFVGKVIKEIKMIDEEQLLFLFADNTAFELVLDSDCCAHVYMSTPDNLQALNGEVFQGFYTIALPDEELYRGDVKEAAILEIKSDKDSIVIYHYNEHNGYYSGTSYTLLRMDDVVEKPVASGHAAEARKAKEKSKKALSAAFLKVSGVEIETTVLERHINDPFKSIIAGDIHTVIKPPGPTDPPRCVTHDELAKILVEAWRVLAGKDDSGS